MEDVQEIGISARKLEAIGVSVDRRNEGQKNRTGSGFVNQMRMIA